MPPATNWVLIVLGACLILLEVLLGAISGFDFLLLGSAILLGGALGLLTGSPAVGVAAAGALALLYVFVGRRRVRHSLKRPDIPSNTDALLGKPVEVVAAIHADRPGRIKFEGEEWRACIESNENEAFEVGSRVRVRRIDGVTVYVEPLSPASSSQVEAP